MEVRIELPGMIIDNVPENDEKVSIQIDGSSTIVRIEDLKIALRKISAK